MSYLGLEKTDLYVVLGLLGLLFAGSYLSLVLELPIMVEAVIDALGALIILGSLYFVYRGAELTGGTAARAMTLIAISIGYYGLTIFPHVYYHMTHPQMIGPLMGPAAETFMHTSTSMFFLVMAWGFYIFYRGGKN